MINNYVISKIPKTEIIKFKKETDNKFKKKIKSIMLIITANIFKESTNRDFE